MGLTAYLKTSWIPSMVSASRPTKPASTITDSAIVVGGRTPPWRAASRKWRSMRTVHERCMTRKASKSSGEGKIPPGAWAAATRSDKAISLFRRPWKRWGISKREKLATKLKIGLATETHLATAPLAKAHAPSALPSIPMLHALEAGNRGQLLAAAKTYVARKHHNGRRGAPGKNDIVVHRDGVAKGSRKVSEVQVKLDRGSELTLRRERRGSCERSSQGQRHKKKTME